MSPPAPISPSVLETGNQTLRVAFISEHDVTQVSGWSGTPYFVFRQLQAEFGDVRPFSCRGVNAWLQKYRRHFLRLGIEPGRSLLSAKLFRLGLARELREFAPDVIVGLAASVMIADLGDLAPVVHISDATYAAMAGYYPGEFANPSRRTVRQGNRLEARVLRNSILSLMSSEWAWRSALSDYGMPPEKVAVAQFGANLQTIPLPPLRSASGRLRLLLCGVDWIRKGGDIALAALEEILRTGADAQLDIVGCAPPPGVSHPRMVVHGMLRKSDPAEWEKFRTLFEQASLFLLPTRAEACAMVFAEAAAYGLPTVTFDTGGVSSAVVQGETGLLLPPGSGGADFARACLTLRNDPARYQSMCEAARMRFQTELNWAAWGRKAQAHIRERLAASAR